MAESFANRTTSEKVKQFEQFTSGDVKKHHPRKRYAWKD